MITLAKKLMGGSMVNLSIRGLTLLLRFALGFYIVSFLGLKAAGIYGLAIGAVGMAPAILGWGLNYHVARDVIGAAPDVGAPLVKSRLSVTLGSLIAMTIVALPLILTSGADLRLLYLLILILVWLETIALDLYMPMIGWEMVVQANIMVFIRSAAWIPIVTALAFWHPLFRSLEAIFVAWICSHFFAFALLPYFLRQWPVREALKSSISLQWARRRITRFWYIYLSDVSIVGLIYVDRYIVSVFLGLAATGIYSFYWSITNALQTLMMTAVVQVALPRMVKAFRSGDPDRWRIELRHQTIKTLIMATVLGVAVFILTEAIIYFGPEGRFPVARGLFTLLLLASIIRCSSDLMNVGITSSGNDKRYAFTNLVGVFLSIALAALGLHLFGLIGVGLSSLLTSIILLSIRFAYLRTVRVGQDGASVEKAV